MLQDVNNSSTYFLIVVLDVSSSIRCSRGLMSPRLEDRGGDILDEDLIKFILSLIFSSSDTDEDDEDNLTADNAVDDPEEDNAGGDNDLDDDVVGNPPPDFWLMVYPPHLKLRRFSAVLLLYIYIIQIDIYIIYLANEYLKK